MKELMGRTVTISNGVSGSLLSGSIIHVPQSAMLGMNKIQGRPTAAQGEIAIRSMMDLALLCDHHLIESQYAVSFLVAVKDCLEDPRHFMAGE